MSGGLCLWMRGVVLYGPCPSRLRAAALHYACAYILRVLLLFVCLANGCLNRCGSHISPLISRF